MPSLTIDGKQIQFKEDGRTILDIARAEGIYIPTLCDHPDLPPHGGCRMCLVEVKGMRGFVTACTTPAKDNMIVDTTNDNLMKLKRSILQLLLIEHPSACVVCNEWNNCIVYRSQPFKSGLITGCTTCPSKASCELRDVVEYVGLDDLGFLPRHKEMPVERDDPFFDRDYNICILCARCVRVCDEIRGTGAISFAKRGHETRVDTAFGKSHLDSGCWFCGACIDVCPTGALSPRMMKWHGTPDEKVETTCMLCGTGCQIEFDVKWDKIMASNPGSEDSEPNLGHTCVLGRFCIPSLMNAPDRLKNPTIRRDGVSIPVSWDEAYERAAEILSETDPRRVGFVGGPHHTTEAAYLLQKLARGAIGTSNVDFRGSGFASLVIRTLADTDSFTKVGTLRNLEKADWIIAVGGDFVKTHQVVAKSCYQAVARGAPLILIGEAGVNLKRWATEYVSIKAKDFSTILSQLAEGEEKLKGVKKRHAEHIKSVVSKGKGAIVFGSGILLASNPREAMTSLLKLIGDKGRIYPTFDYGNEVGAMMAGLQSDLLPGLTSAKVSSVRGKFEAPWGKKIKAGLSLEQMRMAASKGELDVLYVTDGSLPVKGFKKVKHVIYQSPFPSEWVDRASVILPAAGFAEDSGTVVNMEMKQLKLKQVTPPTRNSKQDWLILTELGRKLGAEGFKYKSPKRVAKELREFTKELGSGAIVETKSVRKAADWNPVYRGAILAERIRDLKTFIDALPERERPLSTESMDDFVKRLSEQEGADIQVKEVA
ncbi:MAG: molybdopterin-dependent oxidoreductase [Candidatus Thorarchaeota archaeon]